MKIDVDEICEALGNLIREGGLGHDRPWIKGYNTGVRTAILTIKAYELGLKEENVHQSTDS